MPCGASWLKSERLRSIAKTLNIRGDGRRETDGERYWEYFMKKEIENNISKENKRKNNYKVKTCEGEERECVN